MGKSQVEMLARAVESCIYISLRNAERFPDREEYWRAHADKMESKFNTQHGKHYSHFLGAADNDH